MNYREQHSADGTWYIEGGSVGSFWMGADHRPHPWGWDVVIAGTHVATFLRRSDARTFIRAAKSSQSSCTAASAACTPTIAG